MGVGGEGEGVMMGRGEIRKGGGRWCWAGWGGMRGEAGCIK